MIIYIIAYIILFIFGIIEIQKHKSDYDNSIIDEPSALLILFFTIFPILGGWFIYKRLINQPLVKLYYNYKSNQNYNIIKNEILYYEKDDLIRFSYYKNNKLKEDFGRIDLFNNEYFYLYNNKNKFFWKDLIFINNEIYEERKLKNDKLNLEIYMNSLNEIKNLDI